MKYLALIRGINVGGHKKLPMADLRAAMAAVGFSDVQTLLASGNVVFESDKKPIEIEQELITLIENHFGFTAPVLVRPHADIVKLVKDDPFKDINVTKETRLYVTFVPHNNAPTGITIPYQDENGDFQILHAENQLVCSVLDLSDKLGSVDAMAVLEQAYGKEITTRNWNTVLKISAL